MMVTEGFTFQVLNSSGKSSQKVNLMNLLPDDYSCMDLAQKSAKWNFFVFPISNHSFNKKNSFSVKLVCIGNRSTSKEVDIQRSSISKKWREQVSF